MKPIKNDDWDFIVYALAMTGWAYVVLSISFDWPWLLPI